MPDLFITRESAENDLLAAAAFIAERIKSSDGHADAMSAILPLYLAKGEVDLAAELANAVADPHSRDKLLTVVAENCAKANDDEYAIQLAEAIEDHGLRSEAFERIGAVKAVQGNLSAAFEIADLMNHPDYIYATIAAKQAADGDEAGADTTLERIEFSPALSSALQSIAAAEMEKGESDKAVQTLERAAEAADETEHDEERIAALCEIGNQFIDAGRKDRAVETFDKARSYAEVLNNVHKDRLLVTCAVGFLHAGSLEFADDTLDLVKDKTQMASALMVFARDSWKREEKDEAVDTLEEAFEIINSQREAETRDSRARHAVMAGIAAQFAVFEQPERAMEVAQKNPDPHERSAALTQIAQILIMLKNDELAREAIDLIEDDADRVAAYLVISDAQRRLGQNEESLATLDEAASMAESVAQFVGRSKAMNNIAARYVEHGLADKVRAIGIKDIETVGSIRDESSQASALASLSEVYDAAGLSLGEAEKAQLFQIVMKR